MDKKIISKSFEDIHNTLIRMMTNGTPELEDMRCIFSFNDSDIIHILTAFDFIDLNPNPTSIKHIQLCQMVKK